MPASRLAGGWHCLQSCTDLPGPHIANDLFSLLAAMYPCWQNEAQFILSDKDYRQKYWKYFTSSFSFPEAT